MREIQMRDIEFPGEFYWNKAMIERVFHDDTEFLPHADYMANLVGKFKVADATIDQGLI
jgi:hypothetical protein